MHNPGPGTMHFQLIRIVMIVGIGVFAYGAGGGQLPPKQEQGTKNRKGN